MTPIGKYQSRQVYWFNYENFQLDRLPTKDWLCLATSGIDPDSTKFKRFIRHSIDYGVLEFKGHGAFGEKLHDLFDEVLIEKEASEDTEHDHVVTTSHNGEALADAFWQCFFATCLTEAMDIENISIVCTDLEGIDRTNELKNYLKRFEEGWIP